MSDDKLIETMARAIYDAADAEDYVSDYKFHGGDTCLDGNFDLTRLARAALTALEAAGYVVVPREPTEEMDNAGVNAAIEELGWLTDESQIGKVYTAMLAASQKE